MLQYNKNLLHIKKAAGYTPPTPPIPDPSYYVIGDFTGGGAPAGWSVGGGGGGGGGAGFGGGGIYSIDGSPVTLKKSNMPSLENAYMVEIVVNCSIKSITDTLTIALRTGTTDNYTGTKGTNGTSPQLRSFFRDGSITNNTSGTLIKGRQSVKATIILEDKDELLQGSTLSNMGVNLSHSFSNITNAMNYVRNSDNLYVTFSGETIVNSIDMYVYVRQPTPPTPVSDDYFCITAAENGSVALNKYGTPTDVDIEISSDKTSWSDYTFGDDISLNTGEKVYFRNKSETQTGFSTKAPTYVGSLEGGNMYYFTSTNNIYATGDVNSLLCRDPSLVITLSDYCFTGLFLENTKLLSFEKLPNVQLGYGCYCAMFAGCTALTYTPTLPATTVGASTYASMFRNCTSLTIAPVLPATTLGAFCYFFMFGGCTSLTRASTLSATTLNNGCYQGMFSGCTALTTAPDLPATTLDTYCYAYMFNGCTALTTVPSLPATTLVDYCYDSMFSGCTALTAAPNLPATTLADNCYAHMFSGCTALTAAPNLPATTLAISCYAYMFARCTSLTTAPSLPATTLVDYCYAYMFYGCNNIKLSETQIGEYQISYKIPTTGTGVEGTDSCVDMFTDTGGTFTGTPSINTTYYLSNGLVPPTPTEDYLCFTAEQSNSTVTLDKYNDVIDVQLEANINGIWSDYTIGTTITLANVGDKVYFRNKSETVTGFSTGDGYYRDGYYYFTMSGRIGASGDVNYLLCKNSTLDLSNAGNGCFCNLFINCSCLTTAPSLPATTLIDECYKGMFQGCTSLTVAPSLPATNLASYCYRMMFYGCSGLTTAPTLSATTLATYCYNSMFYGCTSLTVAPSLPATNLAEGCYRTMFDSCNALVNIPSLPAINIPDFAYYMMFRRSSAKINATQTGEYQNMYRIPISGTGTTGRDALYAMFSSTGGVQTPTVNTTYYTNNQVI